MLKKITWKKIKNLPKRFYRKWESHEYKSGKYAGKLKILDAKQTVHLLQKDQKSFCRFGDGEIAIMCGNSIAFQKYNKTLAERLKQIFSADEPDLAIGINYFYLTPVDGVNDYTQNFLYAQGKTRKFLLNNCNCKKTYIDAAITQMYQNYINYDFDTHFLMMQQLFKDKKITLVCGKTVLENIQYNALDVCENVQYQYEASINAFDDYPDILQRALQIDKDRIVCVILGPTAKVLVYDLYKAGYVAWDIGHYLKDYDVYMRKLPRTDKDIEEFFKPD